MTELLIYARQRIPWVQANLILTEKDDKRTDSSLAGAPEGARRMGE